MCEETSRELSILRSKNRCYVQAAAATRRKKFSLEKWIWVEEHDSCPCSCPKNLKKFQIPLRVTIIASVNLQRLPLTRALEWFFSLLKPGFRGRQTTVSMVFWRALTEKVPSSLNEGRRLTGIISNDDRVFNFIYFIMMKDYIVKTTRSLRAEWSSRNTLYS